MHHGACTTIDYDARSSAHDAVAKPKSVLIGGSCSPHRRNPARPLRGRSLHRGPTTLPSRMRTRSGQVEKGGVVLTVGVMGSRMTWRVYRGLLGGCMCGSGLRRWRGVSGELAAGGVRGNRANKVCCMLMVACRTSVTSMPPHRGNPIPLAFAKRPGNRMTWRVYRGLLGGCMWGSGLRKWRGGQRGACGGRGAGESCQQGPLHAHGYMPHVRNINATHPRESDPTCLCEAARRR
jgi:hypothetical protein